MPWHDQFLSNFKNYTKQGTLVNFTNLLSLKNDHDTVESAGDIL